MSPENIALITGIAGAIIGLVSFFAGVMFYINGNKINRLSEKVLANVVARLTVPRLVQKLKNWRVTHMKILVVGSTAYPGPKKRKDFEEACQQLGAALAKAGHTIIVGSDKKSTADLHVVLGAASVDGRHKVVVIRPKKGATPYEAEDTNYKNINFTFRRSKGSWAVGRIHQILDADAVIMVGGGRGTAQVGYTAPALERPVLAIAVFGGAARAAWEEYLELDYERLGFFDYGFLGANLMGLKKRWDEPMADLSVKATEELVKHNPYRSERNVSQKGIVALQAALYVAWVYFFVNPISSKTASFFLLLAISALLGTGLRTSLRFIREVRPKIPVRRVLSEGVIGLILAFGLALFYLAGSITITGDVEFVADDDLDKLQRIGVYMSILGFSAGLLIERAIEQLTRRLEDVVSVKDSVSQ